MCTQLPLTYNLWEGPEDDWMTVETCSPIVISENKCCADVKKYWSTYRHLLLLNLKRWAAGNGGLQWWHEFNNAGSRL